MLLIAGCGSGSETENAASGTQASLNVGTSASKGKSRRGSWSLRSAGEGTSLSYSSSEQSEVRLFCAAGGRELLVNVPAFRPVDSEERLSFGSSGESVALVADTKGDRQRGGVSGVGPIPEDLAELIKGPISVNYGYQNSGPHAAPPPDLAEAFAEACGARSQPSPPPAGKVSACLIQDGQRLTNPPVRAIGTEPFWGAQVEGRCVTYSHPDDQSGTRVWTRFKPEPKGGGTWTGSLEGRPFELIVQSQADCSDGMSDRMYPYAAQLAVSGERRKGCALPK